MTPVELNNKVLGEATVKNLQKRGFDAYYCTCAQEAVEKALSLIDAKDVVAWGGSMTLSDMGLIAKVKGKFKVIDRDTAQSAEERVMLMRQAMLADTFLMSSNAISADGQLVNIDGAGNRCAALIYGPKSVIIVAGINKIVKSLDDAMSIARNIAAPINAQRFESVDTPCKKTGTCMDCLSSNSICNQFVITRRCNPQGRIKVILVGENLGY